MIPTRRVKATFALSVRWHSRVFLSSCFFFLLKPRLGKIPLVYYYRFCIFTFFFLAISCPLFFRYGCTAPKKIFVSPVKRIVEMHGVFLKKRAHKKKIGFSRGVWVNAFTGGQSKEPYRKGKGRWGIGPRQYERLDDEGNHGGRRGLV
ncbi:hypothetical protein F4806DRAFT_220300 [Annulohypoxylon nitens]|nr:hypothetical protein F4806DRAFT_220300 [Annulohypoxylon nitens]